MGEVILFPNFTGMNRYMKHMLAVVAALFFTLNSFGQIEAMQQKVDIATRFIVYMEKGKLKKAMHMIQADSLKAHPEVKESLKVASKAMKAAVKAGASLFINVTPDESFTRFICQCQYQMKGQTPENIYQCDVIYIDAQHEDISKVRFYDLPALEAKQQLTSDGLPRF